MDQQPIKSASIPVATGPEAEAAAKRITRAVSELFMRQAFFGSLVAQMPRIPTYALPSKTMATDGLRIFYDVDFVNDFGNSIGNLEYGLCHEVGHRIGKHFARIGDRDRRLFNIAGDHAINVLQDRMNVGEPIPNLYRDEELYDEAGGVTETIYRLMEEQPEKYAPPPPRPGDGGGEGDDPMMFDDHLDPDLTEEEEREEGDKVFQDVAAAAQAAKLAGHMPEALEKLINDLLYPELPWTRLVEDWTQGVAKVDRSYSKPNRRWQGQAGVIRPVLSGSAIDHLVLGIDCSGSVSDEAQREFGGCLAEIVATVLPQQLTVIYFTSEITHIDEYEAGEELTDYVRHGSGGTHVMPVFNHVEQMNEAPDGLIMLTDMGIFDYPEYGPNYPVLWVDCDNDDNYTAPFGRTIRMNTL